MDVRGKLALVTGASGGIGAAISRELACAGAELVLLARTRSKLDTVAAQIAEAGGKAHVYPCDLTDSAAVATVAARIREDVGVPDILVNNAGAGRWLSVEETDSEEAVSMMQTPYFAAFFMTRAFATDMCRRGSGRILNVNSPMAYLVIPGATGYAACRCALRGFNDSLRAELHGTGVGVTHLVLGEVTSDYFDNNPGSHERIPTISKMFPILSPEQSAAYALRAIEHDTDDMIRPVLLKLVILFSRWMPGAVQWLTRTTGWQRPAELPKG